ncbi:MAG TPA: hypothetical protein VGM13_03910 [Thermoanaerobaculia bacterium]|jgi:hypothetical protein
MKKTTSSVLVLGALLLALLPGCSTNTHGDDAAPVFLVGEFTELLLEKLLVEGSPVQFKTTTLRLRLKTPGSGSVQFLDVQIDSYVVRWTRLDGGTKVSASEPFGGNVIVPLGGTSTLNNYQYMTADALLRPPLDQLYPFNGGIDRETGRTSIRQAGHVIWYGHTLSGQPVVSNEATFDLTFRYSAASGRIEGQLVR